MNSDIKVWEGIHLPAHEQHLIEWMTKVGVKRDGRHLYQGHKYAAAMKWVRQHRHAVDVGAHVGLWSWPISKDFEKVTGFEPMRLHAACWRLNMAERPNAVLHETALGEHDGTVFIRTRTPGSSGDTGVDPAAEASSLRASVDVEGQAATLRRLDDYHLQDVDFLKIDCEGYELFVLRGAEETLKRCRPCVIVEQKPETGGFERYGIGVTDAVEYLKSLGAVVRTGIQGDYILSWEA